MSTYLGGLKYDNSPNIILGEKIDRRLGSAEFDPKASPLRGAPIEPGQAGGKLWAGSETHTQREFI